MWLSKKVAIASSEAEPLAEIGTVSIGGAPTGVITACEKRKLSVVSPGGYLWSPRTGKDVLIVTTGNGESVIVGEVTPKLSGLEGGELRLGVQDGTEIYFKNEGGIAVKGNVELKGDVSLEGDVELLGDVNLTGRLFINGHIYLNGVEMQAGGLI